MQGDSSLCLSISLTLIHNHLFDQLVAPIFNVVSDELPDLKFVKVDTDIHEETVDMFNIQGLPMFILFDQGKPIATHSGALNKTKLREFIESNLVTRKNIDAQPIIKHISRSISTYLKTHQNRHWNVQSSFIVLIMIFIITCALIILALCTSQSMLINIVVKVTQTIHIIINIYKIVINHLGHYYLENSDRQHKQTQQQLYASAPSRVWHN